MVKIKTFLNCLDNSGAALVECANVIKKKSDATIGDRIVVVVKKTRGLGAEGASSAAIANRVKKGDIRQAVVVRTRQNIQRPDGSVIKFGDNACVLINKSGDPIGTRVTGLVGQELRSRNWSKILSLASMHL